MKERTRFLIKNLIRGFISLAVITGVVLFVGSLFSDAHFEKYLQPIYDNPFWVFVVFTLSEIIFGIIPPEIFMLWAMHSQSLLFYIFTISLLSVLSYGAGALGYYLGRRLHHTQVYRYIKAHLLKDSVHYLHKYGGFIVIVASFTPLPFSAISMLVGAVQFPFNKFLRYAAFRFLRFAAYSFFIWHAYMLS